MLKLSKITDYGTLVMSELARQPDQLRSATELAADTHVAAPTVSKTLKLLVHSGLVRSIRGAHGGYRLARAPRDISMADIIAALEGPLGLTECTHEDSHCSIEGHCSVRPHWQVINAAILGALSRVSLDELARPAPEFVPIDTSALRKSDH